METSVQTQLATAPRNFSSFQQSHRGVFGADQDPKKAMSGVWFGYTVYHLGYSVQGKQSGSIALLAAVLKRPWQDWWAKRYDTWYTRQWKYDAATGLWQVTIPHPGRYVIAPHVEQRPIRNADGTNQAGPWQMYPGVLIDATNSAMPTAELVYPPENR
jgi:hypothetical protein